ncbi:MAG: PAS domain S-box protein [Xanthobacteraceae bacterium]
MKNGNGETRTPGEAVAGADNSARKQAEETLLKAGALQNAIFNSANFSSIATDAKGVIQIFNVGAERMLGYTAAEVVNKITPADISDPHELTARATALSAELATPITQGFEALVFKASRGIEDIYELTYIRKDGSRFPAVVSVTALRDAQNTIIGYLLIGTDNTARKHAEEELLKAGALQRAIFNSANFSSIATDAKGVIQIFNVGAERMLGYTAAEVMNKITPADISDSREVIARAKELSIELGTAITPGFEALVFKASRGIEDIYELTYIRKDGSRFPAVVSVTALRDAQNVIIGYLLIGTDNTARKLVEAEQKKLDQRLRDQQFYTRSLIESNIDALMTTDPSGIITDVNKQMEALTGCTRDELIGAPFKDYFTDPERAEAGIKRVLNEKKITDYELTARARDGKETVVSYNATTFYDRGRTLQGVFAAARDVTERKQRESDALSLTNEISHRIKNNLQVIVGLISYEAKWTAAPCVQGYKTMQARIGAIAQLYDLISQSSRGRTVAVDAYLREIAKAMSASLLGNMSGITIEVEGEPVEIDPDRAVPFGLLVNELTTNAIKHAFPDGKGHIKLCVEQVGDQIELVVSDDGVGMKDKDWAKSPEKRGSNYLAIFVRQLGGTIVPSKQQETGTTVRIRLPLLLVPSGGAEPMAA